MENADGQTENAVGHMTNAERRTENVVGHVTNAERRTENVVGRTTNAKRRTENAVGQMENGNFWRQNGTARQPSTNARHSPPWICQKNGTSARRWTKINTPSKPGIRKIHFPNGPRRWVISINDASSPTK